jgi:hypothetical protein
VTDEFIGTLERDRGTDGNSTHGEDMERQELMVTMILYREQHMAALLADTSKTNEQNE